MSGYLKIAFVSILMMGLLAVPNLSQATDGSSNRDDNGRHRLLNTEVRSKIEHVVNKIEEHREDQDNHGGLRGSILALQSEVASLKAALAAANVQLSSFTVRLRALETGTGSTPLALAELAKIAPYVTVNQGTLNGLNGPHVIFHGANVHVQSGSGTTAEAGGVTGLGNLIVGYNEMPDPKMLVPTGGPRVGSHNLVVGPSHAFTSTGGAVFGNNNIISALNATILGGDHNSSAGVASSVLGGFGIKVHFTEETYP